FASASTQVGTHLWNTHTIALGSFPSPFFYEINTDTNTIKQSGFYFASGTSDDFNASIVADANENAFTTWSSTDSPNSVNAQVPISGRQSTDSLGVINAGSSAFNSTLALTNDFDANFGQQRWGDYSAIALDPSNAKRAWFVNEKIQTNTS